MSLSPPPFRSLSTSMGKCPEARVNNSRFPPAQDARVESEAPRCPCVDTNSTDTSGGLCPPLQGPPGSHAPPEQAPWPHWLPPALLPQLLPTRAPCSQSQPPCSTPRLLFPPPPRWFWGSDPLPSFRSGLSPCEAYVTDRSPEDGSTVPFGAQAGARVRASSPSPPAPCPSGRKPCGSEPLRPEHSRPAHLPFPRLRARQAAAQKQGLAGFPEAQWEPWSVLGEWQLYEPFLKTA